MGKCGAGPTRSLYSSLFLVPWAGRAPDLPSPVSSLAPGSLAQPLPETPGLPHPTTLQPSCWPQNAPQGSATLSLQTPGCLASEAPGLWASPHTLLPCFCLNVRALCSVGAFCACFPCRPPLGTPAPAALCPASSLWVSLPPHARLSTSSLPLSRETLTFICLTFCLLTRAHSVSPPALPGRLLGPPTRPHPFCPLLPTQSPRAPLLCPTSCQH